MRTSKPDYLESIWWLLFANGGVVMAVLVPVHILFQGILGPLGIVPVVTGRYSTFVDALGNPLIRLYLHRFRVLTYHLGFHWGRRYHPLFFYGLAILGTLATAYVIVAAP